MRRHRIAGGAAGDVSQAARPATWTVGRRRDAAGVSRPIRREARPRGRFVKMRSRVDRARVACAAMSSAVGLAATGETVSMPLDARTAAGRGRACLGLALIGFGVENVAFGHYVVARAAPWPADPLAQQLVAAVAAVIFLAAGAAILTGRWTRDAAVQAAVLIAGWSLCLHWPKAVAGMPLGGDWTNALKAVVLAAGCVVVAARAPGAPNAALSSLGRLAPQVCAPFFLLAGIQHILFLQFVETLIPPFIPFARFWTCAAAGALLAAGFGLLVPPVRRLAATLTAWMVFSWVFLVHVPLVFRLGPPEWQGVFEALGISGVCFLLAADAER
jgi:uncharacterized membrane protein YphA (DoxX/SURF4 family)